MSRLSHHDHTRPDGYCYACEEAATVNEVEPEIDVCLGCGRYYTATLRLELKWRESFNYRENTIMPQLCIRCV